ncbi:homeobox protein Rhox13-like [Sciurus carolinensis]|uniref:homeobox protein Rhox13-like n=1 Tax=Sciurus carolinensis TaxID=30640 RepID=UPI001FB3A863|nr:homeobox protein Rhox13-like [Sciurus carolinensis]
MASWYHYYDTDYYVLEEYERETNPEPEQGAAAAAEGGLFAEGAVGLEDDMKHEGHPNQQDVLNQEDEGNQEEDVDQEDDSDHEDDGGDEDPQEEDLEEPVVPRSRRRQPRIPFQFTPWQLEELENVFEETQYPDLLMRRELGRQMNVPEAKVQTWFNNRRAKYRKNQRESMLRRIPPGVPDYIFMADVEEP